MLTPIKGKPSTLDFTVPFTETFWAVALNTKAKLNSNAKNNFFINISLIKFLLNLMYVFDNYTNFDSTKNIHVKNNA